jgi:hypothetical protein
MKKTVRLPQTESEFLSSLAPDERDSRLKALHDVGWSFSELGDSLTPRVGKTTVYSWVSRADARDQDRDLPIPPPKSVKTTLAPRKSSRYRTASPDVPEKMREEIRLLAAEARNYRSRTPPGHPSALANEALTSIAKTLRGVGVPTAAIAAAAGVSYRAMARRISK